MTNNNSDAECALLRFYLLGRWDVFLDDVVGVKCVQKEKTLFYLLLRELIPFRVQKNSLDPLLADGLSPSQLFKLHSCRSHLTDILIAISSRQPDANVRVLVSSFLEFLIDILKQCFLCLPWVEHLIYRDEWPNRL